MHLPFFYFVLEVSLLVASLIWATDVAFKIQSTKSYLVVASFNHSIWLQEDCFFITAYIILGDYAWKSLESLTWWRRLLKFSVFMKDQLLILELYFTLWRFAVAEVLRRMYNIQLDWNSLPQMPKDGDSWSVMHSWVLPTRSFLEFVMFSRYGASMLMGFHRVSTCWTTTCIMSIMILNN